MNLASQSCEGAMRTIAPSMLPHASVLLILFSLFSSKALPGEPTTWPTAGPY